MSLETRIANLERRCRALTIALAAAVVLAAVVVLTGAAQIVESQLRFQELDVRDPTGAVRIHIGRMNDEFGVFVLDPRGQTRAALSDAPDASGLSISKEGGSLRLLANRQGADITLRDAKGAVRAVTTATATGAEIELHAANGQVFTVPPPGEQPAQ